MLELNIKLSPLTIKAPKLEEGLLGLAAAIQTLHNTPPQPETHIEAVSTPEPQSVEQAPGAAPFPQYQPPAPSMAPAYAAAPFPQYQPPAPAVAPQSVPGSVPVPAPQYQPQAPGAAPQYQPQAPGAAPAPQSAPQYQAPALAPAPQYQAPAPAPAPQYQAPAPAPQVAPNAVQVQGATQENAEDMLNKFVTAGSKLLEQGKMADLMNILNKYGVQAINQIPLERYNEVAADFRALKVEL